MASCCSCFTMWSLVVFMYTRGTAFTALSAPSSTWPNLAVLRAAGHGRSRMDASVESCRNVVHGGLCAGAPLSAPHSLEGSHLPDRISGRTHHQTRINQCND